MRKFAEIAREISLTVLILAVMFGAFGVVIFG